MRMLPAAMLSLAVGLGCATTGQPQGQAAAIQRVFGVDAELGAARNHAPETGPLADAVREYVAGLENIDYDGCPEGFATAFGRHRAAWADSIDFFAQFGELRGEMHVLFEEIRRRGGETQDQLEAHEAEIWGTWSEVEDAAREAGALDDPA